MLHHNPGKGYFGKVTTSNSGNPFHLNKDEAVVLFPLQNSSAAFY